MGTLSPREQIEAYVEEVWPDYLRDLERLVAVPSVVDESQAAPGAPWGPACRQALDVVMEIAEAQGLEVSDCEGALAYGDLPGASPEQVATIAHVDVVCAGQGWDVEPYAVTRREGVLLGRGVLDDKGAAVASLYAAGFLARRTASGHVFGRSFRCLLGASEEAGMMDVRHYLASHEPPAFLFTPDAEFAVCCGEKGCVNAEVSHAVDPDGAIESLSGGVARNAVPARAEAVLRVAAGELPASADIEVLSAGEGASRVVAHGIAGHAAEPTGTRNAIGILADYLLGLGCLSAGEREFLLFCVHAVCPWDGSSLGIEAADELFGPLTCVGGMLWTRDGRFSLTLDVRLPDATTPEEVSRGLERAGDEHGCEVLVTHTRQTFSVDPASEEVMALRHAYEEFAGREAVPFAIGGGTYAHHFPRAVGFGPLDRSEPLPSWVGPEHGPNEGVWEIQLKRALAIYIRSLEALLG